MKVPYTKIRDLDRGYPCSILACVRVSPEDTEILNKIWSIEKKHGMSKRDELPDGCPVFELVSNAEHIRNKMTEEGRRALFEHPPPFSPDEIYKIAEKWTEQTGMGDRSFFKGTFPQLAALAAIKCVLKAGISISKINMIKVARNNLALAYPSLGDYVMFILMEYFHDHVHCHASCLDYQEACCAGLEALRSGWQAIRSGDAEYVLVIAAEMATTLAHYDKKDSNLFSDGSGAVMLCRDEEETFVHMDGRCSPEGGNLGKIRQETEGFQQEGKEVMKFILNKIVPRTIEVLGDLLFLNPGIRNVHVIPHQPSIRLLEPFGKEVKKFAERHNQDKTEDEKVDIAFHMDTDIARESGQRLLVGNTSSASTFILLAKLLERGEIQLDSLIYLVGFGSGLCYISISGKANRYLIR